jgi:uncharacterized protein (DUF488 family)
MMYYRRRLLLALLEVFDGSLKRTDCEKLLFNFCQMTGKNYYDFFPYQYGPFSFLSYYDKRRLTELNLLKDTEDFELKTTYSYLKEITPTDKVALLKLKANGLRGRSLIRKIYQNYPQFAARSKIAAELFDSEELKQIQFTWNIDKNPFIYTLGYEGLTIDAFLNKLIANNIMAVVDVRNNPQSMKYGFSKKSFSDYIEKAGMKYIHIPELGIPSAMRKGLGKSISHEKLFEKYASDLLPNQESAKTQLRNLILRYPRIALVCFEADHHFCHRHTLIENLEKERSLLKPIVHL